MNFDSQDFREYLSTRLTVGCAHQSRNCPITNWLLDRGAKSALVSTKLLYVNGHQCTMPEWMLKFIEALDRDFEPGVEIVGLKARNVLDDVLEADL